MAGVTDRPFRQLCRKSGAGLAVSEMVTSNAALWSSRKTQHRPDHSGENSSHTIQIAWADPGKMTGAAQFKVNNGAEIIDINMGCPAKKVCNVMTGSALLQNVNITTSQRVARVLQYTGADGIMFGRAAQGNPWIFREIAHHLAIGEFLRPPSMDEICDILVSHLQNLYEFYGEYMGVRIARKHIGWYCKNKRDAKLFRALVNKAETANEQLQIVRGYFSGQKAQELAA